MTQLALKKGSLAETWQETDDRSWAEKKVADIRPRAVLENQRRQHDNQPEYCTEPSYHLFQIL
jgi:hypothetical protein